MENIVELCSHGCGLPGIYFVKSTLKFICAKSANSCPAVRKKNSESSKRNYNNNTRISGSEKYRLLPQETKNNMKWNKGLLISVSATMFSLNGRGPHKKLLIAERGHICERCKNTHWNEIPITLELEHKDGNSINNVKDNLELLCPNCHSQTLTWRRSKSKSNYPNNRKHSTEEIVEAIKSCSNMHQTLKKLGLKWGSYTTVQRVMIDNNLSW